jgi:modulator of FtsH protease
MDPLDIDGWHEFAVATAGAAAALAGLIIVAISVNIKEIIKGTGLPSRAAATIASVTVIVVGASAMLIPDQPALFLGLEMILFALVAIGLQVDAVRRMFATREGASRASKVGSSSLAIGSLVLVLVGGALLVAGSSAGLYFVAAGFIVIFIVSILNAWVLMVEILR